MADTADKKDQGEMLPDKEQKATETVAKEATTSKGEYSEAVMGFIKELNPDVDLEGDNYVPALEKTVAETIKPRMEAYNNANTQLKAMIHGDPKLGKVLSDMAKGARFEEVLPRYYDPSGFTLKEGDPDYASWEAANQQRMDEYKSDLDRQTQLENNRKKSEEVISSWFDEQKMDEPSRQEYGSFVSELLERAYQGEITAEFLNKLKYAMNYEKDVADAAKAGEVKGKNEKIVAEQLKEDTQLQGDKLPVIDGGASAEEKDKQPDNANPLVQGLRSMSQKKTVLNGNY